MQYPIVIAVTVWLSGYVDSRKIRGISLAYRRFYKEKPSFLCIDGSKLIPFTQVNDDYCDCLDGSDEPGTAACSNGRFYCTNLGFRPYYIASSRVNDGVCDCCDTSDEYNSQTRCNNTCRKLGQKERAEVENQIRSMNEGLHLKRQLIKDGINMWQEKQNQLKDLKMASERLQRKLETQRKAKQKADTDKDTLTGLQRLKALAVPRNPQAAATSPLSVFQALDANGDGSLTAEEVQAGVAILEDKTRSLTHAEAIDLLGGFGQVGFSGFQETLLWDRLRTGDGLEVKDGPKMKPHEPDSEAAVEAAVQEDATADLKKVEDALEMMKLEIRDLEEALSADYGADKEFMYLQSQCLELTVYEYTYTLCPFNQVTQRNSQGEQTIVLGKWRSWDGPPGNEHSKMKFDRGEPCWQGPTRSTLVTLTCGTETVLRSVKEPSKCQYVMELQTPAACQPLTPRRSVHSEL
ncbi:glucosidase 2 subunit beta isoform X2 [Amia ocellicauda]|uniref:glucosidase 2 subunit beta isoform X2 n=1 Tax=Amia ocellicauda TaxID=2972642 RepID=UPI003464E8C2